MSLLSQNFSGPYLCYQLISRSFSQYWSRCGSPNRNSSAISVYTNSGNNQGEDQVKVKPGRIDSSCYNAGGGSQGQTGGVSWRYCNGGKAQWPNPGKKLWKERKSGGGGKPQNSINRWHRSKGIFPCLLFTTCDRCSKCACPYTSMVIYRRCVGTSVLVSSECVYNLLIRDCHGWPTKFNKM